jgi:hypothetical protein
LPKPGKVPEQPKDIESVESLHGARPLSLEAPTWYEKLKKGTNEPGSGVAPMVEHTANKKKFKIMKDHWVRP